MTNYADLIAALRIPMDVTLRKGAPELDEYDEQRKAAADALEAVWTEATAAAYGAAADKVRNNRAHLNFRAMEQLLRDDPLPEPIVVAVSKLLNGIADAIEAITPQSARDWLAEREVAIRADERAKAIGEFRESPKFCDICKMEVHALHTHASRAIPIKGKDDG